LGESDLLGFEPTPPFLLSCRHNEVCVDRDARSPRTGSWEGLLVPTPPWVATLSWTQFITTERGVPSPGFRKTLLTWLRHISSMNLAEELQGRWKIAKMQRLPYT